MHHKAHAPWLSVPLLVALFSSLPAKGDDEKTNMLRADVYANRAACNVQLYEPNKVRADCDAALKLVPNHVKALLRRGQALESLEKYKGNAHTRAHVCAFAWRMSLAARLASTDCVSFLCCYVCAADAQMRWPTWRPLCAWTRTTTWRCSRSRASNDR